MIDKEILEGYRTFKDPYQIEKDYLQDLILYSVYRESTQEFVLKGGTAFSKFYFSDRFSEDLDFTLQKNGGELAYVSEAIDKALGELEYEHEFKEKPNENEYHTISAVVLIKGPRYNGKASSVQQLRFEISTGHSLLLKPQAMARNPIYADARSYVALVMQQDEIIAEKIRALVSEGRRHKERDLYDIYYFLGKGAKVRKDILETKFAEVGKKLDVNAIVLAIHDIKQTWNSLAPFVQHTLQDYNEVSEHVISALKNSLSSSSTE